MAKVLMVAYVAVWVGIAIGDIGEIPNRSTEPYSSWLPLKVFFTFAAAAFFGYVAGKEDAE